MHLPNIVFSKFNNPRSLNRSSHRKLEAPILAGFLSVMKHRQCLWHLELVGLDKLLKLSGVKGHQSKGNIQCPPSGSEVIPLVNGWDSRIRTGKDDGGKSRYSGEEEKEKAGFLGWLCLLAKPVRPMSTVNTSSICALRGLLLGGKCLPTSKCVVQGRLVTLVLFSWFCLPLR